MQKSEKVFEKFVGLLPENKKVIVNSIRELSNEGQDKIMNMILPELTKTVTSMKQNGDSERIIYIEKNGIAYSVPVYFNIIKEKGKAELILQKDEIYHVIVITFRV